MADEIVIKNIHLVNAPAGSGKTTWIRHEVDKHLSEYKNDNILCITYTNRAAEELGKEIDSDKVFFGTIHSFINEFISSFFSHRAIIDLYWEMYKGKIQERIENPENKINIEESNGRYIEKYGKLDLETVYQNIDAISYGEAPFTSLYRGALSHDDLIVFTRIAVDRFPIIKKKIERKYQLIFIDEYQDTSADVLHIFFEAMKQGNGHMYLLGDKMQQIYKNYDGSFETQFLQLDRSINLNTNYRTTPCIVSILNNIYNEPSLKQKAYSENKDADMSFLPKFIIATDTEKEKNKFTKENEKALVLYLSNRERFCSINAGSLFEAVGRMERYQFGSKYTAVDMLIKSEVRENDALFYILFLIDEIDENYGNELYGNIFRLIRKNAKNVNTSRYLVRYHEDKKKVNEYLSYVLKAYHNDKLTIGQFFDKIYELEFINTEFYDAIISDEEYKDIFECRVAEVKNLADYLKEPNVSTQHGVKGESHDTVVFMAENSNNPPVNMKGFFEIWSNMDIRYTELESFYYEYKEFINRIEDVLGMKCSAIDKTIFAQNVVHIIPIVELFAKNNTENKYYQFLISSLMEIFLQKQNVTTLRNLLKENKVYGILSAYKLFYVGCSRARRNLLVLVKVDDIKKFKDEFVKKIKSIGFNVEIVM